MPVRLEFCQRGHSDWAMYEATGKRYCRVCKSETGKQRRLANPEKWQREKNAAVQRWRVANPDRWRQIRRNATMKLQYGIGLREKEVMWLQQYGCCGLCFEPIDLDGSHIDHCHQLHKVRGLL